MNNPDAPVSERPDDLIPVAEAIRLLPSCRPGKQMALSTVYRWIQEEKLRAWKVGRWTYVSRGELLALLRPQPIGRTTARKLARKLAARTPEEKAQQEQAEWTARTLKSFGL